MNESKRRGFLEGTLMEQSMNFFFFFLISVWASGPCSESWFRKQKRHAAAKEQRRKKKMEKKFDIFVELAKFFVLGLFFDHFLVYFFFSYGVLFFFYINILLSLKLESEKYKCLIYKWNEGKRTGMQDSGIE